MALAANESVARSSADFVQSSILEAVVPANENADIESLFKAWDKHVDEGDDSLLPFIEQRHFLFLGEQHVDELVPLFIVLRTHSSDEEHIKGFLSRLSITVEAFATGHVVVAPTGQNSGEPTSPHPVQTKDLLYSQSLDGVEQPLTLLIPAESAGIGYTYLIWKTSIFIGRPKARLQKLGIYFAVGASVKAIEQIELTPSKDEYLPSGVPTSPNLLEAFSGDPALHGAIPHLPVSRIMRSAPTTPAARDISSRPIRSAPRRIFRAGPALAWRVRFNRVPTSHKGPTMIASLDIEATPFASCDVEIETVDITLANGHAESLSPAEQPTLPAICRPGDQYTFLCMLTPGPTLEQSSDNIYPLDVGISGAALIAEDCKPKIRIKWKTNLDIAPPAPRPPSSSRPDTSGQEEQMGTEPPGSLQSRVTSQELGMVLTVTGPSHVYVGEVFRWNVFVVNRSATPKRFAILVLPKRSSRSQRHGGRPSISSISGAHHDERKGMAEAVMDENAVQTQLQHGALEPAELVSLSPDVRIGPLGMSACFTTEIRFLALVKGVLHIDSLRLVDLSTQETIDIRDLPDVVAIERGSGT